MTMTVREGIAWSAAVLAIGACGWVCAELGGQKVHIATMEQSAATQARQTQRAEAEASEKAAALESARAEADRLKTELEEAGKARAALEARLDEVAKAAPPPAAAAPPKKKKKGQLAGIMEMVRKMQDDPAMRDQMRQGVLMQLDMMYGDLFKEWGLEGEALEAAKSALADRLMTQMDLGFLLMDETVAAEEVLRRQQEIPAASREALAQVLDAGRLAALEAYEKELPARMLAKQTDTQLAALKLDPAVHERVRGIVVEESLAMQERASVQMGMGGDGMGMGIGLHGSDGELTLDKIQRARGMMSGEGDGDMGKVLQEMAGLRGRILERAQPLLTQEQFERFRKQQEAQAQMMEMGMKMFQGEGGE